MPKGFPLDLHKIQALLFERADRQGRVRLNQSELALELGITKFTMSRVIQRMTQEDRIRQVSHKRLLSGIFVVEDPALYPSPEE